MVDYTNPANWSSTFTLGSYDPVQQYRALMAQNLGGYYTPQVSGIAQRAFEPTYGSYLLGGYGDTGTTGLGTGASFADWMPQTYSKSISSPATFGLPSGTRADLQEGWNLASKFANLRGNIDQKPWTDLAATSTGAFQMGESMRDPAAIRAMAMAQLYGGQLPASGWLGQRTGNAMNRFYNTWAATQPLTSDTGLQPAGFIPYLAGLNEDIWGNTIPT